MDEKQLQALASELVKTPKPPEDLNQFDWLLKKLSVEVALSAEMTHRPGYKKNQPKLGTNFHTGYLCAYAGGERSGPPIVCFDSQTGPQTERGPQIF